MNIAERLKVTADMVRKGSYVADIGTDHAYIPIYLVKNNICSSAVATDVRKGPLDRAKRNISMYGLGESIKLKQGWGLEPVYDENIDCAILAGMGGYLICNILKNGEQKLMDMDCFILQPMQFSYIVRKYLYDNGYTIYDESLVKENNRIFEVMAVTRGHDSVDDTIYYEVGKRLIEKKDPLLKEFIQYKIDEVHKIIEKVGTVNTENSLAKIKECDFRLKGYEGVMKWL